MSDDNTIEGSAREIPPGQESADLAATLQQIDGGQQAPGAGPTPEQQPQPAPTITPEEAVRGVLEAFLIPAQMAGMTRTTSIWTPEVLDKVAISLVAVLRKYAWGQKVLQFLIDGLYVEEMMLLMLLAPLVRATAAAVKADIADIRKAREEAEKAAA